MLPYICNMAVRIVFLGSKPIGYQCLQYLLAQRTQLGIELLAIRTQQRSEFDAAYDLEHLAQEHQLPLLNHLHEIPECDIIYSVQHHELLKPAHIAKAKTIAVNLHLAPLPEYRGCNQFSFAIMDEVKEFGVTIHEIDQRIDHGAILFEQRFPIDPACWVQDLYQQSVDAAYQLFVHSLGDIVSGNYKKTSQTELLAQRPAKLHYRSEIQELKHIDINQGAAAIEKRIRATAMPGFEPPYCLVNGQKVYFQPQAR